MFSETRSCSELPEQIVQLTNSDPYCYRVQHLARGDVTVIHNTLSILRDLPNSAFRMAYNVGFNPDALPP